MLLQNSMMSDDVTGLVPETDFSSRVYSDAANRSAFVAVFATISFNFVLCFINTNVLNITAVAVIGSEVVIIAAVFALSYRSIGLIEITLVVGMVLYLLCLALFRTNNGDTGFDPKIIRDFTIPVAFFALGTRVRNLNTVDKFLTIVAIIVTGLAIFEYFFVETYLHYFNVIKYYIARGTVESARLEILSTNLFVSGIRPEGRTLLPFLGDHRVSSIFLEPVSPGGFAVILFYWAMVRTIHTRNMYLGLFVLAVFLTIMADNRFGAYLCALAAIASIVPIRFLYPAIAVAPFCAILGLLVVAVALPDGTIDNSLIGRILSSGRALHAFDSANWFGIGSSTAGAWDCGYAYTIGQTGILGFTVFWIIFMLLKANNLPFQLFRIYCGLYFAAILCVSYSPYTIKTAALLWFLLGALSAVDYRRSFQARLGGNYRIEDSRYV